MKKIIAFILIINIHTSYSQIVLESDGPGNTYELINSVLAPGYNVIEVPDCAHATPSVEHIDEVFDTELNTNVFRFIAHKTPDNDRCQYFDRQRTEIKTYDKSPDNLLATIGETVIYKWKFKISSDFQPSSRFTHVHQIKSVGGSYASTPMVTLTLRKSTPDILELRYTSTNDQNTLKTADLDLFRGNWVSVIETITYSDTGSYAIEIKNISNNETIFNYTDSSLDAWQDGAEFARPKWGIYRSLISASDLKDEAVLFADFSIEEVTGSLLIDDLKQRAENILLYPNPSSKEVNFKNANSDNYDSLEIYDYSGRKISKDKILNNNKLDVSSFSKGLYFIVFKKNTITTKILKFFVK